MTNMTNKAIGVIVWVIVAVFVIGLVVTIVKAYWLWLALVVVVTAVLWFGSPVLIRLITTRTWHK